MGELAYGEGIKILSQAEALVSLLAKGKSALVLADQLEPKIAELSQVKERLVTEVKELQEQKATILFETEEAKQKIIREREAAIASMQEQANEANATVKQKFQAEFEQWDNKIKAKTKEFGVLEDTFHARKALLDSEIANSEKQLKDTQDALEKVRVLLEKK